MRKGVSEALLGAEGGTVQVLIAPTGYGKTSSVHLSWGELSERWGRVVHVLPLRAIVSDAASKAVERGVPREDVSYQASIAEVKARGEERVRKSPYMLSRYVVTTYDSFSYSLYVAPVAELSRVHAHRDVGLLAAAGGGLLFDEAHLVLATDKSSAAEEASKVFTVLLHEIEVLSLHLRRPVVLATATLPAQQVGDLANWLASRGLNMKVHLCLGRRGLERYRSLGFQVVEHGLDPDYLSLYKERYENRVTTKVSRSSLLDDVLGALEEHERVAVFCNTVGRALSLYSEVKGRVDAEVVLIHGRIAEGDKASRVGALEEFLKKGERVLAITTQVLEAGVDFDFDAVVTEAASPGALIQRAGRAYRHLDTREPDGRGLVIINASEKSLESARAVYPSEAVSRAVELLSSTVRSGGFFDWRACEDNPCFADLLAVCDAPLSISRRVYAELDNLLRPSIRESVRQALESLDEWASGALMRDSALIPLYTERGPVTVSVDYLKRAWREVLELIGQEAKAVFTEGEVTVNVWKLLRKPVTTLYELQSGRELGEFLGLKVKEGAYHPEVGLA